MSGEPRLAIDTSFVIALLRGDVRSERPLGEIAFPVPVVGELRFGAMSGRHPQQKLEEIEQLVSRGTILLSDGETSRVYAEVRHRLKAAGTPLPENDVWIGAACIQHGLPLLTLDRHFDCIDGLRLATS